MEAADAVYGVEGITMYDYFKQIQSGSSSSRAQPPPPPSPYSLHHHIDSKGISNTDDDQYSYLVGFFPFYNCILTAFIFICSFIDTFFLIDNLYSLHFIFFNFHFIIFLIIYICQ